MIIVQEARRASTILAKHVQTTLWLRSSHNVMVVGLCMDAVVHSGERVGLLESTWSHSIPREVGAQVVCGELILFIYFPECSADTSIQIVV